MTVYLENEFYIAAVDKFAAIEPCPVAGTGRLTADQVKIALGELFDIWPASIAADA